MSIEIPEDINLAHVLERYIDLKEQQKEIEFHLKKLQTQLLLFIDPDSPKFHYRGYDFSRCERASWDYPTSVKELESQLKAAKKEAEKSGTATPSYTTYLRLSATPIEE